MSDRHEWQRDAAVWVAGRRIEAALPADPAAVPDPRLARALMAFHRWQAAARLDADAARFAERVRGRLVALGRGIRRIEGPPESVRPDAVGPLAPMVLAARRVHAAPLAELGVAAGSGRELLDEPCDTWVALPADLPSSRYVALRVVGDSMLPLLHSGDLVLLDLDAPVRPGMIAVARHPEHGYVVKRVARMGADGSPLSLVSLNPAYPAVSLERVPGALMGPIVLRWCPHAPAKPRLASRS
jgi:SOS-response transcriptional repressor LexA